MKSRLSLLVHRLAARFAYQSSAAMLVGWPGLPPAAQIIDACTDMRSAD